ncbi:MAG TPA: hypothetical protein VIN60_06770 [Anaerolineales bacterium]
MSDEDLLDLYSDYLVSAFGQTTATGLAALLEGQVSPDQFGGMFQAIIYKRVEIIESRVVGGIYVHA